MCKKLTHSISFVLLLGLVLVSAADAELVGWWKLDDGSGTTASDSSGNGNDGDVQGDPQWVQGKLGGALEGDGAGDFVRVLHSDSLDISDAVTVAMWVFGGVPPDQPISKGEWNTSYGIRLDDAGGRERQINWRGRGPAAPAPGNSLNSTTAVPDGEWVHVAVTFDVDAPGNNQKIYINGILDAENRSETPLATNTDDVRLGAEGWSNSDRWPFDGILDDIRIYNEALAEGQIQGVMLGGGASYPLASGPSPADGALHEATWVSLGWRAGDSAASHDVYLGDNFDDVNDGTIDLPVFRGNLDLATTSLIAGFFGFPFPDGLVPGTTYYWRVDEVNDANTASPWKGDVWSFVVPPRTAYNPIPGDGAKFIEADGPVLGWTPGFNAKLHTVYFGASFDEVDAATGGTAQSDTTFTAPGPLEVETTYYWRVDEFDPPATHKGPVWSFVTARDGGGVKGEYFTGMVPSGTPVLTREDPQIDFSWGNAEPDPLVGADNFSARWTGEVEAAFTETYTFYTSTDDGARLWVDGQQLVNAWVDQGTTEYRGTIDLVAGNTYSVVMEYYENGGGAVARLLWSSPRTPKQPVPQAALSLLVHAHSPNPSSGTEGLSLTSDLAWGAGDFAESHDVYFGTDADAVANATKAYPEFKGSKALGQESLDPGQLLFDTTYYWRVDEINPTNPDSPWVGNVWTFWTGDFVVVEDFEGYNDLAEDDPASNRIYLTWIDGFGTTTNGAVAGNLDVPLMAPGRDSAQAMPISYDNAGKTSEATRTLTSPTDWTANGVTKLSLWFNGATGNSAERMFVALGNAVVYHPDDAATQDGGWNEWVIDLQEFANQGANLSNVTSLTIGFGTRNAPVATGGTGTVEFDDIRLIQ